jgi:putative thioredoxin
MARASHHARFGLLLFSLALAFSGFARSALAEDSAQPSPRPQPISATLDFRDYEAATKAAATEGKTTVLFFGARWCKWCRKMAAVALHDRGVIDAGQAFVWSKIDIDDQPDVAARYGVRGVPALRLIDSRGELVASRDGYLPAETLQSFLSAKPGEASATRASALGAARAQQLARIRAWKAGNVPQVELERVLDQLANSRIANPELIRALSELGPAIAPALVAGLDSRRLAIRAAAYQLLLETTSAKLPFDPFASEATRKLQAQRWAAWLNDARAREGK